MRKRFAPAAQRRVQKFLRNLRMLFQKLLVREIDAGIKIVAVVIRGNDVRGLSLLFQHERLIGHVRDKRVHLVVEKRLQIPADLHERDIFGRHALMFEHQINHQQAAVGLIADPLAFQAFRRRQAQRFLACQTDRRALKLRRKRFDRRSFGARLKHRRPFLHADVRLARRHFIQPGDPIFPAFRRHVETGFRVPAAFLRFENPRKFDVGEPMKPHDHRKKRVFRPYVGTRAHQTEQTSNPCFFHDRSSCVADYCEIVNLLIRPRIRQKRRQRET